jgi:hypothetical protein
MKRHCELSDEPNARRRSILRCPAANSLRFDTPECRRLRGFQSNIHLQVAPLSTQQASWVTFRLSLPAMENDVYFAEEKG